MANYNRTIISGNLGNDPKVADDGSWTHASIATSNSWKDKKTDEWMEKTQWHRVMAYGYAAEKLAKCVKGENVLIEGGEKSAYIKADKIHTSPKPKSTVEHDDIPFP